MNKKFFSVRQNSCMKVQEALPFISTLLRDFAFGYPRFTCLREHVFDLFGCEGILISRPAVHARSRIEGKRKKKNEELGARRSRRRGIPNIIIGDACMGHLASFASLVWRGTAIREFKRRKKKEYSVLLRFNRSNWEET